MKKINFIIAACLVLSVGTLASCGSDYLDTTPTESIGTGTAVGTAENAYKALNGIARTMSTQQYAYSQGAPERTASSLSMRTMHLRTIYSMHMHLVGLLL